MKTNFCLFPTLEHCRPQNCLFGRMDFPNKCLTSYDVLSAALMLSVQLPIIKKKRYLSGNENNWLFVSYFWGWEASFFKTRIHKVTGPVFYNLRVIYKTYVVKTNTCFEEKSLLSDTRKHVCTIFPLVVQLANPLNFLWVLTGPFWIFLAGFGTFYETIGNLSSFFLFRRRILFLTYQDGINYHNKAHCSIVRFYRLF